MPVLSVIIPVLNEELYIEECLESALEGCPEDVEFIIIDDGSSDNTAGIVRRMADRIVNGPAIILKQNVGKGVAAARQYGIGLASGEYISFLDGDDTVEQGLYRKLIDEAEHSEADIICFENDEKKGMVARPSIFRRFSSNHEQRIRDCISLQTSPYLCTKLVRKELFNRISFPPGNLGEDWAIIVQLFLLSGRISIMNEVLYHYRISDSSFSRSMPTRDICLSKALEEKKNIDFICDIFDSRQLAEKYKDEVICRKTNVKRMMFPILKKRIDYSLWRNIYPEINFAVFRNPLVRMEYLFKHFLSLVGILHLVYPILLVKRKIFYK